MRKTLILWLITLCTYGLQAQTKADSLTLTDPEGTTFVLLPDVQNYVKFDYNQPVLELLLAWIAENKQTLNIRGAFCTGDLVDQNESLYPLFPRYANISSTEQWTFVAHAFSRLDNRLPYFISPGNHDYGYTRAETDYTQYPDYFPIEKNPEWKELIRTSYPNRLGRVSLENAAFEMEIPNWKKLLIITTEFAPRDEVLQWVDSLGQDEAYKEHYVILLTHSYMTWTGERIKKEGYKISGANAGQAIWDKLLNHSKNIKLLISGHYGLNDEEYEHTTGFRQDMNAVGNQVTQLMFNTQTLGGGWSGNGGDGWLRLLEFLPDGEQIAVRTYSPLFGFSAKTKYLARREAAYDAFTFKIN